MVGADVPTLLDQAVCDYLDRLAEQKIIAESKAFKAMHADLLQQYKGEYVAVHNGKVVDHDADIHTLNHRIRTRYGHRAVLLQQVAEQHALTFPSLFPLAPPNQPKLELDPKAAALRHYLLPTDQGSIENTNR